MKKQSDIIIFGTFTVVLVIIASLLFGMKAYGKSVEATMQAEREAMEREYLAEIKAVLQENGFQNSGVNMTKESDEDGRWEYDVVIYNPSFEWMNPDKAEKIENTLAEGRAEEFGKISLTLLAR